MRPISWAAGPCFHSCFDDHCLPFLSLPPPPFPCARLYAIGYASRQLGCMSLSPRALLTTVCPCLCFWPHPPPSTPSPCRLYAVGYASRQLGSRSQLDLLLSNPPTTPGAAIHPADWLTVCHEDPTCAQCGVKPSGQQVGCCHRSIWFEQRDSWVPDSIHTELRC